MLRGSPHVDRQVCILRVSGAISPRGGQGPGWRLGCHRTGLGHFCAPDGIGGVLILQAARQEEPENAEETQSGLALPHVPLNRLSLTSVSKSFSKSFFIYGPSKMHI